MTARTGFERARPPKNLKFQFGRAGATWKPLSDDDDECGVAARVLNKQNVDMGNSSLTIRTVATVFVLAAPFGAAWVTRQQCGAFHNNNEALRGGLQTKVFDTKQDTLPINNTTSTDNWPPLESLIVDEENGIIGNVQFLLDFSIVATPKTGSHDGTNVVALGSSSSTNVQA